jgi:hypothetical protein
MVRSKTTLSSRPPRRLTWLILRARVCGGWSSRGLTLPDVKAQTQRTFSSFTALLRLLASLLEVARLTYVGGLSVRRYYSAWIQSC